jgi:hypothetical protein
MKNKKELKFLILIALFLPAQLFSQFAIQGKVVDKTDNTALRGSIVMVLHPENSFLYKFARSDENGIFKIEDIREGKYLLLVARTGFVDYMDTLFVSTKPGNVTETGTIKMELRSALLDSVVVKAQRGFAVRVVGDTTEFKADSFKVQPNAKVEDLLKQLPGIRIDSKGNITADGERVKKVLVDGEEFFNDDPLLVTRNVRADMVDKVQVYNRSSDKAMFTGIEDDKKDKTINLQIKKDKKNVLFGKISAGRGDKGMYNFETRINKFSDNYKLSVFGVGANDGNIGVNQESREGENLKYDGNGLPVAVAGGAHYDSKWNDGKNKINGNYKFSRLTITGENDNIIQNNLPDKIINTTSRENFYNRSTANTVNGRYDFSRSNVPVLSLSVKGAVVENENKSDLYQERVQDAADLLSRGGRTLSNSETNRNLYAQVSYRKQLKKQRRTIAMSLSQEYNQIIAHGLLQSSTVFYSNGDSLGQVVDQLKNKNIREYTTEFNATYTEPLGKYSSVLFRYTVNRNSNSLERESYDNPVGSGYTRLDSFYSSRYDYDQLSQQWGAFYDLVKEKVAFNVGSSAGYIEYDQQDLLKSGSLSRHFLILNPKLKLNYRFTAAHWIKFSYNANNVQPQNEQIQPVASNENPLSIYVGNAGLKPSFNNSFNLDYLNFKLASRRTLLINSAYSFVTNPIITNTVTGSNGVDTFYFSNMKNETFVTYNGFLLYSRMVKAVNVNISGQLAVNGSRFVNYANYHRNLTNATTWSAIVGLTKLTANKYEINVNNTVSYSQLASSLQKENKNNYWSHVITFDVSVYAFKRFRLNTNANYNYRSATNAFSAFSYFIWNAWLGRTFLKNDAVLVKFAANDMLNQNIGFKRQAVNNMITQNSYTTIRRYFMLSLSWDFNKVQKSN